MKKGLLSRFLQSFNPNAYSDLAGEHTRSTVKYFFIQFGVLFLIMTILFLPSYLIHADSVSERLALFTNASLDGRFTSDVPVILSDSPRIVFSENATSTEGALLMFGQQVYFKKYIFFGDSVITYETLRNLSTINDSLLALLAIFILPSIIFWSGLYVLLKALILLKVVSLLGWMVIGAFRQSLSYRHSTQVAFYASVPALTVEMLTFPFFRSAILSLLILVVWYVLGAALLSKRKLKSR